MTKLDWLSSGKIRHPAAVAAALLLGIAMAGQAVAADVAHIGVPTKAYWPTIVVETAMRQKLFAKEGLDAKLTIYKGGGEELEALAAGAADLVLVTPALVATGRNKGVQTRIVSTGNLLYSGWHLMVLPNSPIKSIADLKGKKVAITSSGSGTDLLALWAEQHHHVTFTRVSVGGPALVPSLLSGNVEAAVIPSPLSFKLLQSKQARSILSFADEIPPHLAGGWTTTDKLINGKPQLVQKTLNAVFGGLDYLRTHRDYAIKIIGEIDEIDPSIAAQEYKEDILTLSTDGSIDPNKVQAALDLSKLVGLTDLAPTKDTYTLAFKPVPTKP